MRAVLTKHLGYIGLGNVQFPVAVAAYEDNSRPTTLIISTKELKRIGADMASFSRAAYWHFNKSCFTNIGE